MRVFRRAGSPRWYGYVTMASGNRKQVPLLQGKRDSQRLLHQLQKAQDGLRADGMTGKPKEQSKSLTEHLAAFEQHLRSKGNTDRYVNETIGRIQRVMRALKITQVDELDSDRIANLLAHWRRKGMPKSLETRKGMTPKPLSAEASNHYTRRMKEFSRYLWNRHITTEHRLRGLSIQNPRTDRRHVRRVLNESELSRLIQVTHDRGETIVGKTWTLSGPDRAVLYRLAAFSGLRASEIASLCPASIDFSAGTIRVEAASSKHRKDDVLPIHPELVGILKPWLESKVHGSPLFPGRWNRMASKIIQKDLQRAGIPYVDSQGRYFDFHALRHQFATMVCRSGIPVGTAMKLLRHSSPELTLRVYNDVAPDDLRDALKSVPGLE